MNTTHKPIRMSFDAFNGDGRKHRVTMTTKGNTYRISFDRRKVASGTTDNRFSTLGKYAYDNNLVLVAR